MPKVWVKDDVRWMKTEIDMTHSVKCNWKRFVDCWQSKDNAMDKRKKIRRQQQPHLPFTRQDIKNPCRHNIKMNRKFQFFVLSSCNCNHHTSTYCVFGRCFITHSCGSYCVSYFVWDSLARAIVFNLSTNDFCYQANVNCKSETKKKMKQTKRFQLETNAKMRQTRQILFRRDKTLW